MEGKSEGSSSSCNFPVSTLLSRLGGETCPRKTRQLTVSQMHTLLDVLGVLSLMLSLLISIDTLTSIAASALLDGLYLPGLPVLQESRFELKLSPSLSISCLTQSKLLSWPRSDADHVTLRARSAVAAIRSEAEGLLAPWSILAACKSHPTKQTGLWFQQFFEREKRRQKETAQLFLSICLRL